MHRLVPLFLVVGCVAGSLGGEGNGKLCAEKLRYGSSRSAIVNGSTTSDFPAVGFLSNGGGAFCTATLIGERLVLTAAHCVEGSSGGFYFGIGSSDRSPDQLVRVTRVTLHPSWNSRTLENDIAKLELESQPTGVSPLPVLFDPSAIGWTIKLVGFGVSNGYAQSGGGIKREVDVTIAMHDGTTWGYRTSGGGSACNGDSGGPGLYRMGSEWVVMGVTSYGDQYCVENGFYTRTDLYSSFLTGATTPGGGGTPPPADPPPADPPPGTEICENSCRWAGDGECDDGGPGSLYDVCAFGSDCTDCGPRMDPTAPPPPDDDEPKDPPPPIDDPPDDPPGEDPPSDDPPSEDPPGEDPPAATCTNTCPTANDGECDDGGPGALCSFCALGTDCGDCGPR